MGVSPAHGLKAHPVCSLTRQHQHIFTRQDGAGCLEPGPTTHRLCGSGKTTLLPCASVSPPVKYG